MTGSSRVTSIVYFAAMATTAAMAAQNGEKCSDHAQGDGDLSHLLAGLVLHDDVPYVALVDELLDLVDKLLPETSNSSVQHFFSSAM